LVSIAYFQTVSGIGILGSSPLASVDGIMLVVERVDPPGVSGTERRRKRAHGAPQAVISLPQDRGTLKAATPANPNQKGDT
jgi:hypothetical protein